ncbi:MAG: Lrp/AsnC ligand binding domain-containing protein [Crenarchaeota archaeon]|nr:Lrp/AsnC ligand binding domain-containing protein [Thermoproteota archaeon]MCR8454521.1 Lrp/AsnC ligand binding domain-containing protein [Thermoproteota archaeon]MCR8455779.1 Lrp/AsnC ligand binding domain-containing protein [Thermoproteota archaeon]MCR8463575.1 Lrp/AsnC ligand binding domain-containing protein [Thermoproteota archaeon]MCR8470592.1 Lrp/AsnC ligand binding domain-containing protein [Thermoproteota archaeon]
MKAYVLLRTEAGKESQVLDDVIKINGVKRACLVFGPFDVIAEVEVLSHEELDKVIVGTMRRLSGVRDTLTLIVAEERSR